MTILRKIRRFKYKLRETLFPKRVAEEKRRDMEHWNRRLHAALGVPFPAEHRK